MPARLSLAEETGFWNKLDPATAEAYKWAIANPGPSPERTPDYAAFGPLSQAVEQVLGPDKKEPRKALQDAQKELERLLAETQLTPTPAPNNDPVVVATPEPQEAPEGATVVTFAANSFNPPELRRLARAFRDIRPDPLDRDALPGLAIQSVKYDPHSSATQDPSDHKTSWGLGARAVRQLRCGCLRAPDRCQDLETGIAACQVGFRTLHVGSTQPSLEQQGQRFVAQAPGRFFLHCAALRRQLEPPVWATANG